MHKNGSNQIEKKPHSQLFSTAFKATSNYVKVQVARKMLYLVRESYMIEIGVFDNELP